jgi:hypothetical protein
VVGLTAAADAGREASRDDRQGEVHSEAPRPFGFDYIPHGDRCGHCIFQYEFPETPAQEEAREVVKAALVAQAQVEKQKRLPLPPRKCLLKLLQCAAGLRYRRKQRYLYSDQNVTLHLKLMGIVRLKELC